MADVGAQSGVLRRKLAAGQPADQDGAGTPAGAFRRALVRAAEEEVGLVVTPRQTRMVKAGLDQLLEHLPEAALLIVVEAPDERRGLVVLDPQSLAALVEVQTTGRVVPRPAPPRMPTRTDALLVSDFVNRVLALFHELAGAAELAAADLAAGMVQAFSLADARAAQMTLPETTYTMFEFEAEFGDGAKTGQLVFALPRPRHAKTGTAGASDWSRNLEKVVSCASAELGTVLARKQMSLAELARLRPGAQIMLPGNQVEKIQLCDLDGRVVGTGILGQADGFRAVMLTGGGCDPDADQGDSPDAHARDPGAAGLAEAPAALPQVDSGAMPELPDHSAAPDAPADPADLGDIGMAAALDPPAIAAPDAGDIGDVGIRGGDDFPDLSDLPDLSTL